MSHGRSSVPAPEREPTPEVGARSLLSRVRAHFAEWPDRYVRMRTGKKP